MRTQRCRAPAITMLLCVPCCLLILAATGRAQPTKPKKSFDRAARNIIPSGLDKSLTHDGLKRTYRLYVPQSSGKTKPMPLVIALHGGMGTGNHMERLTRKGLNALADKEGFAAVYPDGIERHWNDGRKEAAYRAHKEKIDDTGFISKLIDHLIKDSNIDPGRVYVTGASNGAMMSYRLACEIPEKIAAIAPVMGALPVEFADAKPSAAMPVLMISGTADPLVPWTGGNIGFPRSRFRRTKTLGKVLSQKDTVNFWVKHNQCAAAATVTRLPDTDPDDGTRVRREAYAATQQGGAEVILYAVESGGHTWPGGYQYLPARIIGKTCRDIHANAIIWDFFKRHQRKSDALPGSNLSVEDAVKGKFAFAAVCEALDAAGLYSREAGVTEAAQRFRIVENLAGNGPAEGEIRLGYTCFDLPGRRERAVKKGERLIWIIHRLNMGAYRGIKALPHTPANRKAMLEIGGR